MTASHRVFLDTNIFIHLFDGSAPLKQAQARELVNMQHHQLVRGVRIQNPFLNLAHEAN